MCVCYGYIYIVIIIYYMICSLGKQRRGARPGIYRRANTAVLRHIVQNLEKMRILDKDSTG